MMMSAPRASQLSGSTAVAGSSASLSSLGGLSGQNGNVIPTANIINQKADASRSLYQICISLKNRLAQVPGFDQYLEQLDPNDPVDGLWGLLRTGIPLITVYNALQPETPLQIDEKASETKKPKIAIFKFVKACMDELKVPPQDSFVVTDLMGNDTSGFVKVRPTTGCGNSTVSHESSESSSDTFAR
jgi:cell division control protein 24